MDHLNLTNNINDVRKFPDRQKFIAFKRGWKDASKGKLYDSISNKKTHTNIDNLFGWIYGECPKEMIEKDGSNYYTETSHVT